MYHTLKVRMNWDMKGGNRECCVGGTTVESTWSDDMRSYG